MAPKPDALRTFIAVAECGTLAAASERLSRTPSAISTTLKHLETSFGGALFDGERKSQLTALGAFALDQSRRTLRDFDASIQAIRHFATGRQGRVRVAAVPSVATRLLPDVVLAFQHQAPEVALEIRDVDSIKVGELVHDGQADIGLASQARPSTELDARTLITEPFLVVCASDHRLTELNRPIEWSDLASERFISHGLLALIGRKEIDSLIAEPAMTVHNVASMISFVEKGLGITLLPAMAVPSLSNAVTLPLAASGVAREVHILTRGQLSPAAEMFSALITERAQGWAHAELA